MRVAGTALVAHGRGCHSTQATLQMVRPFVRLLVKLEASARKAPSVQLDPMNLCLAHPVTIAIGINLTRSLECVQLDIIAMEARSIVTQSTKPLVIGVQRAITVQLKVPIQHHAYQVLMLIQNTTSSRTTVNLVSPACSAQSDIFFFLFVVKQCFWEWNCKCRCANARWFLGFTPYPLGWLLISALKITALRHLKD